MTVQILGGGCPKCQMLERNAVEALAQTGIQATIEKVTDFDLITEMGVLVTPALAVDGVVKKSGKVLTVEEIGRILTESE